MHSSRLREVIRLGVADPWAASVHWKDSPSPPPPPDFKGAANAQGAANVQTAIAQALLGNINQTTPYGNLTYSQNGTFKIPGADGQSGYEIPLFNSNIQLSPEGQKRFDQEQRIILGLGNIAEEGLGRIDETMGKPFDMSGVPDAPDPQNEETRKAVAASILERQQPYFNRTRETTDANLMAQGFNPGGEAWRARQDDINRAENDYRLAADVAGGAEMQRLFGMQTDARENAIQEQAFLRSLPLNELNALRSGAQVGLPQFQSPGGGPNIQPPPFANAAGQQAQWDQNVWNQQAAATNASNQGMYQLGGAALGAAAAMFF